MKYATAISRTVRTARPSRQTAFTLIEMMTVLLIVGLLSTFAYPAYRQAKLKNARAEGRAALLRLMQQEERYYTGHHRYRHFTAGDGNGNGNGNGDGGSDESDGGGAAFHHFSGANAAASAYRLEAAACESGTSGASDCLLLRAVPANGFDDPACGVLSLDSAGRQDAAGAGACR